jgi:hypothetical protein
MQHQLNPIPTAEKPLRVVHVKMTASALVCTKSVKLFVHKLAPLLAAAAANRKRTALHAKH